MFPVQDFMLPWMTCPAMLRVTRSECVASLSLLRSLGDYIEAMEWMSLMRLDLGATFGPSPRQKEYRGLHRRDTHTDPLMLKDM